MKSRSPTISSVSSSASCPVPQNSYTSTSKYPRTSFSASVSSLTSHHPRQRLVKPSLRIRTPNLPTDLSCPSSYTAHDLPQPKDGFSHSTLTGQDIEDPLGTLTSDPFAPPELGAVRRNSQAESSTAPTQKTRMSAWGRLPLPVPLPTHVPLAAQRAKQPFSFGPSKSRGQGTASHTSEGLDAEYEQIHLEEALLSQRLLKRLESGVGWVASKSHAATGSFGKKSGVRN